MATKGSVQPDVPPCTLYSSCDVIYRSLRDGVPGAQLRDRRDRGPEDDELHADRGRRPHVNPPGDLAAQAAAEISARQHCQVRESVVRSVYYVCTLHSIVLFSTG